MKKSLLVVLAAILIQPISIAAVNYVPQNQEQTTSQEGQTKANQDQTDLDEEGIAQENIIIQISQDAYVASHGNHYHAFNGLVPADGIFLASLLAPSDYQFQETDIIQALDHDGAVITYQDQYYLYYPEGASLENLRSQDELILQASGLKPEEAAFVKQSKQSLDIDQEQTVKVKLETSLQDLLNELKAEKGLVIFDNTDYAVILIKGQVYLVKGNLFDSQPYYDKGLIQGSIEDYEPILDLSDQIYLVKTTNGLMILDQESKLTLDTAENYK